MHITEMDIRELDEQFALMTLPEVVAALRVSRQTVWRLRVAGTLPEPLRIGMHIRWRRRDIEAFINGEWKP